MENVKASDAGRINFLTFFWGNKYTEDHVLILNNALNEYCRFPFQFHILTDRCLDLPPEIEQYELWHDHETEGRCWRRLRAFHYDTMKFLGHYFAFDVDLLLMPDFGDLVQSVYRNPFTLCRSENPHHPNNPFSGTMWQVSNLHETDRLIWQPFQRLKKIPANCPLRRLADNLRRRGYNGSDSAVLGYCLRNKMVNHIGAADGVYSYPHHIRDTGLKEPPENARVILFHGEENEFLDPQVRIKYKFVDDYLRKFWKSESRADIIETVAKKHFVNLDDSLLESLRGFSRDLLSVGRE